MGLDFSALMHCKDGSVTAATLALIDRLERGELPPELSACVDALRARNFHVGSPDDKPHWVDGERDVALSRRPILPNPRFQLRVPGGFTFQFGRDALRVYHLVRWSIFIKDAAVSPPLIDACRAIGRIVGARACVLAHDCHAIYGNFRNGMSFADSLANVAADEGEVATFAELYTEHVIRDGTALKPGRRKDAEFWIPVNLPDDAPLPPGWQRQITWDSKTFWGVDRFP
jgi:hypothetical protein